VEEAATPRTSSSIGRTARNMLNATACDCPTQPGKMRRSAPYKRRQNWFIVPRIIQAERQGTNHASGRGVLPVKHRGTPVRQVNGPYLYLAFTFLPQRVLVKVGYSNVGGLSGQETVVARVPHDNNLVSLGLVSPMAKSCSDEPST
jgi:hypothetical protein